MRVRKFTNSYTYFSNTRFGVTIGELKLMEAASTLVFRPYELLTFFTLENNI